ncbi:hypothetical protein HZS_3902 [Henneguya salminicola]|nr:hypothetical protein HZS_3902 [Henneguya salminicola]
MVSTQFSHFPGPLKQKNKLHKSGSHKSKRQLCKENKNETNSRKNSSCMFKSKLERANEKKRNIIENKKQIKQHLKEVGFGISPMPIALISLSSDFPIENIIDSYYSDEKYKVERDWCTTNCRDFYRVESLDKRQKFLFLVVTQDSAFYMHDVIQSSQAVWILSTDFSASNSDFTPVFDTFESVLLPPIYHLIKFQKNDQKSISTFLHQYCQQFGPFKPEKDKILEIKANVVVTPAKLIKCVPNFYLRSNYFARQPEKQRANIHVISEALNYDHHNGILEIGGTIRGGKLSANDSVAIPGFGNFKISQIASKSSIDVRSNAAPTILSVRSVEFDLPQNIDAMSECGIFIPLNFSDNNEGFDDILLREDHQLFEPPQFVPMEYDNTHESNADSEYETADSDCFSDVETPSIDNLSTNQKLAYFCSINDCTIYTSLCENPSNRKIIQLNNYVAIKNYAMQYACPAEVESGKSVKVSISDVPYHVFEYFSKIIGRLTIHKIYPYEDQVLDFSLQ